MKSERDFVRVPFFVYIHATESNMANIGNQSIGNLNILLKQGNTEIFNLSFNTVLPDGTKEPIDLTQYTAIKMDVKDKVDVNSASFVSWTLGDGLTITGADNNVLSFTFGEEFVSSQNNQWYYDILFTSPDGKTTLVGGMVKIRLVVTS